MVRRKLTTSALLGTLAAAAMVAGCRDEASTGPEIIPSKDYAARVIQQGGDVQVGPVAGSLPQQLAVKVTDAGGAPVQGALVNWVVIEGGGSVNPPTGISDQAGFVRTTWTLGSTLGSNRVRGYLTGAYLLDSVTFTAIAVNGSGVIIKMNEDSEPPDTAAVATVLPRVEFTVHDQFGHTVPGASVTFTTSAGGGTVNPASALTDSLGKVSTVWTTPNLVGTYTLSATLAGQLPVVASVTTTPDTSRRIAIVNGNGQTTAVGGQLGVALTVQVTDRFTNPIAGENVVFNDSLGGGSVLTPASALTDASGMASAFWRLGPGAGPRQIRVRTPGSGGQVVRFNANGTVQFRDVFAGNYYACGVTTTDRVYCWGFGENGQLGIMSAINRPGPSWPVTSSSLTSPPDTVAGPFPTMREVSGGPSHACGITVARGLLCWGFSPDARAFLTASSTFALAAGGSPPISSVSRVVTGESFSCYLTLAGAAFCSGTDEMSESSGANPPPATMYSNIATGQRHGCGMPRIDASDALAVPRPSRTPVCWGSNSEGQLGNPALPFTFQIAPNAIASNLIAGGAIAAFDSLSIVAGALHTCALSHPGGVAFCWGSNAFGQLGKGGVTPPPPGSRDSVPVIVSSPTAFQRLYAGEYHTCGLTTAGVAYCWGKNDFGQLGIAAGATVAPITSATPVNTSLTFRALALGENFTCGITGAPPGTTGTISPPGTIWCWGDNEYGQLGTGAFGINGFPVLAPQRVAYQQ